MTIDELWVLIGAKYHKQLRPVQKIVLYQSWEGYSFAQIAKQSGFTQDHLKNIASKLWSLLSDLFNETLTKKTFRAILEPRPLSVLERELIAQATPLMREYPLESPDGPVPLESPFYIQRTPIEELTCTAIATPGSLIRLKSPKRMGKTSLMVRVLAHARQLGYRTVSLNLQQVDRACLTDLDSFLRSFCLMLSRPLKWTSNLDDYWDDFLGSKSNCTIYLEDYLQAHHNSPLVIALDRVEELFLYPIIAAEFFAMLRYWHEKASFGDSESELWKNLRLILVYSTEEYLALKTNHSPFNVGFVHKLPLFTSFQVEELAERHQLDLSVQQIEQFMELVAGHPYLVRLGFYHLAQQTVTWEELMKTAATDTGIYHNHLHQHLASLKADPDLAVAYKEVLKANQPIELEQQLAFKLHCLGLVNLQGSVVCSSCQLYTDYFRDLKF
ncbi:AAA-like domain-containing protein [Roseofilum reptotaenium CS-1145]|uniref:vWA-MoxR associated protein N-terminal HTH domain-containing protein n=1 Tax=Roseofilum reptotaenium AO1-A TaxID=1925591 RepID=A0A1L9QSH9_9CYAN|nr:MULTISPECIES: AAA-like domain-containing protein [Roseofilum]MBP0029438.1 AAA-like domain-containing protein [Roseofilum sp. Guam]MDB9518922.1 AAA-like domain-containing protein [Roseofilum reptotaenium CS-1145]OJJ25650.1 hypothetical protein BI308_10005 [Roseofilum reptotaenium AO1-A]